MWRRKGESGNVLQGGDQLLFFSFLVYPLPLAIPAGFLVVWIFLHYLNLFFSLGRDNTFYL